MTRFRISLGIGAAAFGLLLAASAAAQPFLVTYVSSVTGDNANACNSVVSPCRTIGGALPKTSPAGEIRCLDNHSEGVFTVDKPVTIDCGATAAIVRGSDGLVPITINLPEATYPNGVVTLRNLTINTFFGNGVVPPAPDGIRVIGGGAAVHVENCTIQGLSQQGIEFAPSSSVDLFLRDTVISNNQAGGILLKPTGGASSKVVFDNVNAEGNATGITIDGRSTTGSIKATVRYSSIAGSASSGLFAVDSGGGTTEVTVEESTAANNGSFGIGANGASATVRVKNSTVTGNANGLVAAASSKVISQGGNTVIGNTTNGAFTSTLPPQ